MSLLLAQGGAALGARAAWVSQSRRRPLLSSLGPGTQQRAIDEEGWVPTALLVLREDLCSSMASPGGD